MHHIVHCIDCVFLLCCRYLSPLDRRASDDEFDDTDEEQYYLQKCQASKTPLFIPICQHSGNGGPRTCLPAACGMARVGAQCSPSSSAQARDPREGPSLAGRTTQSFLRHGLIRLAREEAERSRRLISREGHLSIPMRGSSCSWITNTELSS